MRVLVTGSAGHIGRYLVPFLRDAGDEVRTFDRVAARNGSEGEHSIGDLRDIYEVRRAVQGMDAVAHLGALSHDGAGPPEDLLAVNVQGTWNVMLACREAGVGRVVFFSSVNALGVFSGRGTPAYFPIDDDHPHHPVTPYSLSKHLGEEICRSFSEREGIVTICLRPTYVTEPEHYSRWSQFPANMRLERGKGDYWSYVDVRDVCSAVRLGLRVEGVAHASFLLTADDTTSTAPTPELLERFFPGISWKDKSPAGYFSENIHRGVVDCSRAQRVLDWQPRHGWRDAETKSD